MNCAAPISAELAPATPDGVVCPAGCPPPEVKFYKEHLCSKHKRVSPGKHCGDPPCQRRHYTIDGEETVNGVAIASATTMTKEIGDTFGVAAWTGQTTGIKGTLDLLRKGKVTRKSSTEDVIELLKTHRLTTNHVRDNASDRGTNVHDALEKWGKTGEAPNPLDFAEHEQGYYEGFNRFLEIEQPESRGAEVLVGSRRHAFAGTFDLFAYFPRLGATGVIDYKSKLKAVPPGKKPVAYEQHHFQLGIYEAGRIEMGMDPSDFRAVLNLYPDGTYALIQVLVEPEWVEAVVGAYRALTALREAIGARNGETEVVLP